MKKVQDINESQWQAITYRGGHLLIVAGPGTGKTHTLIYRIESISQELNTSEKVLAITFTNKAAEEMQHRIFSQTTLDNEQLTIGTFHQFCLKMLKQFEKQTDLPEDFNLIPPEEVESFIKENQVFSKIVNCRKTLEEISKWKATQYDQSMPEYVAQYNSILRKFHLLDFDDLLYETLKLLKTNASVCRDIQKQYRYIFVDEYQDINRIQQTLLMTLIGDNNIITVIGDPNQSIYGFRGSDVQFFQTFLTDFPGAIRISLKDNYRSAKNLLAASGQVMRKQNFTYVPALTAQIFSKGRLTIHSASTDKAEAEYVVHQIEKILGGVSMFSQDSHRVESYFNGEWSFGDIAVLYRLNSQRRLLQQALDRLGLPYHVSEKMSGKDIDAVCPPQGIDFNMEAEKVSLMTLHAAKGLEFPVVFIIGCEENLLPLQLEGLVSDVEEERRLFYVGMTRAKEILYLVRAKRRFLYGKTYENQISPFISDIEEELKEYEKDTGSKRKINKREKQMDFF